MKFQQKNSWLDKELQEQNIQLFYPKKLYNINLPVSLITR